MNVTPLAIKDNSSENELKIFPNPVHQIVHLNSTNGKALGKVELLNSEGKSLQIKTISTTSFAWQVEQLPVGVYLFKGEDWSEKVLKN